MSFNFGHNNSGTANVDLDVLNKAQTESNIAHSNDPMVSPIDALFKGYNEDVSKFTPYTNTSTPIIAGNPAAYEGRARAQSGLTLAGHAAAQFALGEFVGGTIQGVGTLLAPTKWIDRIGGDLDAWEPTFIEKIGQTIQEYTREQFPIYQTAQAQRGVALGDASWWATMAPSVASALSILIPAKAAAFLPVTFAKFAGETMGLAKTVTGLQKAEHWATVISSAFAGRVIDSTRESMGRYSQYYDENRAKGMNDQEARESAADAASKGFRLSHANLVFDLAEWGIMLRTGNYLKEGVEDKLKNLLFKDVKYTKAAGIGGELIKEVGTPNKLRGLAIDMFSTGMLEGADEMTMDTFQQEGKYQSDRAKGLVPESTFGQRVADQFGTRNSWDSFVGGALGGILMMPMGVMMEKVGNKNYINSINEQYKTIADRAELDRKGIEEISQHLTDGNKDKAAVTRDQMIIDNIARNASNNTSEWTIKMFDGLSKATPEQLKAQGLNPEIITYLNDYKDAAKETQKIFDKEMNIIRVKDASGNVDEANTYVNAKIAHAKASKYLFDKRVDQFTKEEVDANAFKGDDEAFNYYSTLMYNNRSTTDINNKIEILNKFVLDSNEKINKLTADLLNDKDPVSRMITKGFINSTTSERDYINSTIQESRDYITNLKEHVNAKLELYKDMNPITKKKVEDHFNNTKQDSYSASKDTYKVYSEMHDKNINFWNTKEGVESLKAELTLNTELNKKEFTKEVTTKVDAATTKEELESLRKEYSKTNEDASIYEPIIKAKLATIKAKEVVTTQSARVAEDVRTATINKYDSDIKDAINTGKVNDTLVNTIATKISKGEALSDSEEAVRRIASDKVEKALTVIAEQSAAPHPVILREGLFGEDAAQTQTIVETTSDDINVDFSKLNNLSKSATGLLTKRHEDLNLSVEEFLINPTYSSAAHAISMFDALLKDKTIRDLFRKTGLVEGKFRVSDVFAKLDSFNDFNTPNVEEVNNIISSIFNASSKIINSDATRGYTATLVGDQLVSQVKGNVDGIKDEALDLVNITDKDIENTVKDLISNYIESLEVKTISFATSLDTDTYSEDPTITRTPDLVISYNVGTGKTLDVINENVKSGIDNIRTLLQNKATRLGHAPKAITFDDILKFLRDKDTDNNIVNRDWFNALQSLKLIKAQLAYNIAIQSNIKLTDLNRKSVTDEIKRLTDLDNILNIKSLPYAENKGQQYVDNFLKTHPRQVSDIVRTPGVRAVLNVYDERTGKRITFEDSLRVVSGNNIWQALNLIKVGSKVTFKEDSSVQYEGKSTTQDWQTVPIRINTTDESGNESTILFVRELDYMDSGIRYGHQMDNGEFEFRGVGKALNDNDYKTIYDNFDLVRDFYSNYYAAQSDIKTTDKNKAQDTYLDILKDIKANKELNDLFLKAINNNFDETDDLLKTLNAESLISIINPFFYKINVEDAYDYTPTPIILRDKIASKDRVYESDFESVKEMRKSIADGTLTETTISNVSTPSVLINPHKSADGEYLVRPTLDREIREIKLKGDESPRVVTIMFNKASNAFIDMTTGKAITDPRFDYGKSLSQHIAKHDDAAMYVLLESTGGKLVMFPARTNTIGLSYKNANDRNASIDFVTSKLIAAEKALTASDMSGAASSVKHITIYDPTRRLTGNDRHWFDTHFIGEAFTDQYGNLRTPSNFLRIKTSQETINRNGEKEYIYYQIENEGRRGIVTIYKSTKFNELENRNKGALIKDTDGKVITFDINTKDGEYELSTYLKNEVVPYMQRQVHLDMRTGKFAYEKEMVGSIEQETPIDPVTGREYASPQDYYIQTGALYSDVGSVKDARGNVLTNFNIQGRFPMAVHLDIGRKKQVARTVNGIEGLVDEGVIDRNDPYLDFIRTVAKSTGIKPKIEIKGVTKDNVSASMERRGKRWNLNIYEGFFQQQLRNNPYIPASLLVAHEYLHIALSKSYLANAGESEQDVAKRNERIATHNRELTSWVEEVDKYWNGIEDKVGFIKKAFTNVTMSTNRAEGNVAIFENYIKKIKQDVIDKSGINGTIQEPTTYAFTTPIIAVVLNNMSGKDVLDTKVKTAWDKLRDLFFKALSSIFGIELNDKGFLLKLNHVLNRIYTTTVEAGIDQSESLAAQKKERLIETDISELIVPTKVEPTVKEETSTDEDIEEEETYNAESLDVSPTFDIASESKSLESLTGLIMNPQEQILDVQNNPIC